MKLNFWTTVSALNICNFEHIKKFALEKNIDHHWAFLNTPEVLNVKYKNKFTIEAKKLIKDKEMKKQIAVQSNNQTQLDLFIMKQDYLRKIHIEDYFNLERNLL